MLRLRTGCGTTSAFDIKNRMDVGQPRDFIRAGELFLNYLSRRCPEQLAHGKNVIGAVLIDPSATISPEASIGPNVVIGPGCTVAEGVRLRDACLMAGSCVGPHSLVADCLLGWGSKVGSWCRVEGLAVLGEGVELADEMQILGAIVLPHEVVSESIIVS